MCDSEDGGLASRFRRVFIDGYIACLRSEILVVSPSISKMTAPEILAGTRALIHDAKEASVFPSSNEDSESASSSSIVFCLLPFLEGSLMYSYSDFDKDNRKAQLLAVQQTWNAFSQYCKQFCAWPTIDTSKREGKIDLMRKQSTLRGSIPKMIAAGDFDDVRAEIFDALEFFAIDCKNQLRFVEEELELLQLQTSPGESVSVSGSRQAGGVQAQKPWVMRIDQTNIRSIMKNQVFRPDIPMPTMSLNELARIEIEQAMRRSDINTPPVAIMDSAQFYRQLIEDEELEEVKARAWDDWKDLNPRGSGNKMTNLG